MPGPGAAQAEVRSTMLQAGGYWRPLAAVARLLEELGELIELLEGTESGAGELAGELADLWIITTALADQFRIEVAEPGAARPPASPGAGASAAGLLIAAGRIARVVNYYDGPKTPRSPGQLPTLTGAIGSFHGELELLCATLQLDLGKAVSNKLAVIQRSEDMRRFAHDQTDPSTAGALALLPPGRRGAKLWGAPPSESATVAGLAAALAPSLLAFAKAARAERLDGYVIPAPAPPGSEELEAWLAELLAQLRRVDPAAAGEPASGAPGRLRFNGLELATEILPVAIDATSVEGGRTRALLLLCPGDGNVRHGPLDDGA